MSATENLGSLLLREGLIEPRALDEGLAAQARDGGRIGETLVRLGHLSEAQLMWALARQLDIPYIPRLDLSPEVLDRAVVGRIPGHLAHQLGALPLFLEDDVLTVAMEDPLNVLGARVIERVAGLRVRVALTEPAELHRALAALYPEAELAGPRPTVSVQGWGLGPEVRAELLSDETGRALLRWILDRGRALGARRLGLYPTAEGAVVVPQGLGWEEAPRLHLPRPWFAQLLTWLRTLPSGERGVSFLEGVEGLAASVDLAPAAAPRVEVGDELADAVHRCGPGGLLLVAHADAQVRDAAVVALCRALCGAEAEVVATPGAPAPSGATRLRRDGELDDAALISRALAFQPGAVVLSEDGGWALGAVLRRGRPGAWLVLPVATEDAVGALADLRSAGLPGGTLAAGLAGAIEVERAEGQEAAGGWRLRFLAPSSRLASALLTFDVEGLRWWRRAAGGGAGAGAMALSMERSGVG